MRKRYSASAKRSAALLVALMMSGAPAYGSSPEIPMETPEILRAEQEIMDRLALAYGGTDWSRITAFLAENPSYPGNPNVLFIPLSLANVALNRYELRNDIAELQRAVDLTEWVASNHWLWRDRWLSAPLASYLGVTAFRIRGNGMAPGFRKRIERLWASSARALAAEADLRLGPGYPHLPLDSADSGDSKGEENAWEAGLLAAAANFLSSDPRATAWERKARQLAYNALTRPSDPADAEGVKTSTITEDFLLSNHGQHPNPCYMAATLLLLSQGALSYRLTGRPVPAEFGHNVAPLLEAYRRLMDDELSWTAPADPAGDGGLFPLHLDPALERQAVRRRLGEARLWVPVASVDVMEMGEPLWSAVLNAKAVYFYLVGSYLWHGTPAAKGGWPHRGAD